MKEIEKNLLTYNKYIERKLMVRNNKRLHRILCSNITNKQKMLLFKNMQIDSTVHLSSHEK
jgi:hypothetical protein